MFGGMKNGLGAVVGIVGSGGGETLFVPLPPPDERKPIPPPPDLPSSMSMILPPPVWPPPAPICHNVNNNLNGIPFGSKGANQNGSPFGQILALRQAGLEPEEILASLAMSGSG
jgi:hypothetical protein